MNDALVVDSVTKRYDTHLAVDRLSLTIQRGVIFGILGPNGAGKTTTIRMIMNIVARDSGSISVLGKDPAEHIDVLRAIGYLPEERGLYKKMKVLDVIVFFAELKGLSASVAKQRATMWLEKMGLGEWAQSRVETLSKGMQQKVQFIATVLHEPELLILDEPTSGLDPVNQEALRATILEAKQQGRTIVFSTHNMEQAEQLCDSLCIIANGRKVLEGELKDLQRKFASQRYRLESQSAPELDRVAGALTERPMLASKFVRQNGAIEFDLAAGATSRDIFKLLADLDANVASVAHLQPSLRDIFVQQVEAAARNHTHA